MVRNVITDFLLSLTVNSSLITTSPTLPRQNGAAVVDSVGNLIHNDKNGEMLTSAENGEPVLKEVQIQDDERILMASGVYIGLCNSNMGSPMAMRNGGFSQDNKDDKEPSGFNGDSTQ